MTDSPACCLLQTLQNTTSLHFWRLNLFKTTLSLLALTPCACIYLLCTLLFCGKEEKWGSICTFCFSPSLISSLLEVRCASVACSCQKTSVQEGYFILRTVLLLVRDACCLVRLGLYRVMRVWRKADPVRTPRVTFFSTAVCWDRRNAQWRWLTLPYSAAAWLCGSLPRFSGICHCAFTALRDNVRVRATLPRLWTLKP